MRGRARGNQRLSASEVSALIGAMRSEPVAEIEPPAKVEVPRARFDTSFESLPGYQAMRMQRLVGEAAGIRNPYYRMHEARSGATAIIDGKPVVNFASYDYLGLNGHPEIAAAVAEAAATWGTSVSASRITAGERPLHRELEAALAAVYQVDDAVVFVSGHATAVSALGALMGPRDLVIHDALIHNCIVVGARLSGATRRLFPHNDLDMLEEFAKEHAAYYRRVEAEVVHLALAIARKILHREAQIDSSLLAGIVRVTLEKLDAGTKIDLHVPPRETTDWRHYFACQVEGAPVPEVHEDATLAAGECRVETSLGSTEVGLESQLKEIETGMLDLLAERPAIGTSPSLPGATSPNLSPKR